MKGGLDLAGDIIASQSIEAPIYLATSTTATSTFSGGFSSGRGIQFDDLVSCDTIDTNTSGFLKCSSDADSGGFGTCRLCISGQDTYGDSFRTSPWYTSLNAV